MTNHVTASRQGQVTVLTLDNPPVNAFSQPLRQQLLDAMRALTNDPEVRAVVIRCAGRTFVAGADIKEFDTGMKDPNCEELFDVVEGFSRPVIAALHGTALGAGTELALACHYRCASPEAKIGLPELTLGIIPGAGGTQRLPRIIGARKALEMILDAAPIGAAQAEQLKLIDRVITGDLEKGAVAYAEELIKSGAGPRSTAARSVDTAGFDEEFIKTARAAAAKKFRGQKAPDHAIAAVTAATQLPFKQGLKRETEIANESVASTEAKALRHLFFAEREVARIPNMPADVKAKDIKTIGIVGAGTMGRGIAVACADSGFSVRIVETTQAALDAGLKAIEGTYQSSVARGRITAEQAQQRTALIQGSVGLDALSQVDLVIEAVFEDLEVKKGVLSSLGKICKPGAVIASNTSTLDLNKLAEVTGRPESVIGLHFFSPANIMRLLEIVRGAKTTPEVIQTALELAKRLKKVGVVVGVCFGFVGNRIMLDGYTRETDQLLLEGATQEQVDRALENFGMAMGPFKMKDMGGLDVSVKARDPIRASKARPYYEVLDALAAGGHLGQKTGGGYYRYEKGDRTALHNPVAQEIIEKKAAELGIKRRQISDEEVVTRTMYQLINVGAQILEEGIAYRSGDIDVVYTQGYGFPRFRGGPMFYADTIGLKNVYERIQALHKEHGDYWKPAPLLAELARSGGTFTNWRRG